MGFGTIDYLVVILYLLGVTTFGLLVSGRQKSAADYFLGGNRLIVPCKRTSDLYQKY